MFNIHPSLLPAYRGLHTHRRVLAASETEHGASVHFVTAELDGGPVVLQSRVAVRAGDTEATLPARVQATEHIIYPQVLAWFAQRRLAWHEDAAWLDGRRLEHRSWRISVRVSVKRNQAARGRRRGCRSRLCLGALYFSGVHAMVAAPMSSSPLRPPTPGSGTA